MRKERCAEEAEQVEERVVIMGNSTSLNELDPSEMLEPSSLKCYEETRDLVWQELIRLNEVVPKIRTGC